MAVNRPRIDLGATATHFVGTPVFEGRGREKPRPSKTQGVPPDTTQMTRKPTVGLRSPGAMALRDADRHSAGSVSHDPPRATRRVPVCAPVGSAALLTG